MKTPIVTRYNNDWKSREEYEKRKKLEQSLSKKDEKAKSTTAS